VNAIAELDSLLENAATLRAELRTFETALRKARGHLVRGRAAEDLEQVIDIVTARDGLTRAATDFQVSRHSSRVSIFRAQAAEGMSIGSIARSWGISRQLVSRILKTDALNGHTATRSK
jgi:hypothetical protein